MGLVSDIAWVDQTKTATETQVSAAKLHVLHLDPIKIKLGDRWDKLSTLVHRLFETALRKAQGPGDTFIQVDDLSYVVTFHGLSVEEASFACTAIAKDVCGLLFGTDLNDVTVRGLVGLVPASVLKDSSQGVRLSQLLERTGGEIIVSRATAPPQRPELRVTPAPCGNEIAKAQELASQRRFQLGLFPVWDLQRLRSASLFLSLVSKDSARSSARVLLASAGESHVVSMEIALLLAAVQYADRVHLAGKVGAIGAGVSYETLSGFHSRIDYIRAVKSIHAIATCPILLRIDGILDGTPLGRVAEIVAMLQVPNVKVTVEFQSLKSISDLDIRLGATGIGWEIPPHSDSALVAAGAQKLVRRAAAQKAYAFLHGLATPDLLAAATAQGVRFGSGTAINGNRPLTDLDKIPDFPLIAT